MIVADTFLRVKDAEISHLSSLLLISLHIHELFCTVY